jgi:histidinol phosphatase-like PHP family hydrolase
MLCDFHTHTCLSDGVLLPIELIRRAVAAGYTAIAITEHASESNLEAAVRAAARDCALAEGSWPIRALAGVELTHVPVGHIAKLARQARSIGARIVAVHGETPVEPVEPGTNRAALECDAVDILVHPGLLTEEEARLAAERDIFLEVSARHGHCLGNGRVVALGRSAGARFLVNSDAHEPGDLLSRAHAERVALGAGLTPEEMTVVLDQHPHVLIDRATAASE